MELNYPTECDTSFIPKLAGKRWIKVWLRRYILKTVLKMCCIFRIFELETKLSMRSQPNKWHESRRKILAASEYSRNVTRKDDPNKSLLKHQIVLNDDISFEKMT